MYLRRGRDCVSYMAVRSLGVGMSFRALARAAEGSLSNSLTSARSSFSAVDGLTSPSSSSSS